MGISFKVSRVGTRYRPKPAAVSPEECAASGSSKESSRVPIEARSRREANTSEAANDNSSISVSSKCTGSLMLPDSEDYDASFTVNLFQEGYFIGKPTEPLIQDVKSVASLHPYDRASESLFSAIETGCLPGDILDDIPSKYTNGTLVCEVRDYRNCTSEQGTSSSTAEGVPVINKIKLRMSLENVVKDIPLVSDESWTYSDLMEFESRVLKALRPELNLDPTPMLDRLCKDPCSIKLNIGLGRKKRLRQTPEVTVTFNNQIHGKKVCIDGVLENANCKPGEPVTLMSNAAVQSTPENAIGQQVSSGMVRSTNFVQESARATLPLPSQVKLQPVLNYPGVVHDRGSASATNFAGVNANISSPQNMMGSYVDAVNSNVPLHVKRDNQDAQLATMPALKRSKQTPVGVDGIQQQQVGSQFGGPNGQDLQWRNQLLQSQSDVKGIQYTMMGGQRYPSQVINNFANQETGASFYFNQPGMRYGLKEEQIETDKVDRHDLERSKDGLPAMTTDNIALDQQQSRSQQLLQQSSMRNHLPPLMQWHNPRPPVDKDTRKDEVKRKTVPSPRVSSGPMVQSPVSSKSGEISSGSVGGQFSAVAAVGSSQKEKATANSNAAVGAPSAVSSPSDSVHRQTHTAAGKPRQKSNSVQKPQAMSGIGSPASVSNMSAPLNANSPSIGTTSIAMSDQLERFAKIETMTQRYQLNIKKKANDPPPRKAIACPSRQEVAVLLSNSFNAEDFTDQTKPMSRSLIHGNVNTCKMRAMVFVHKERAYQGVPTRAFHLIMAERPSDGTVALQYGDADDSGIPNSKDCSLTLPNTNHADLLAAQFCKLMERDEHQKSDDQIRAFQPPMSSASGSQATAPGSAPDTALPEVKNEISPSPLSNVVGSANNGSIGPLNSSQNLPLNARMLASGNNSQALQISQGYFPGASMPARPQQLDQTLLQQQQQQQQQKLHQQQQQQMHQNPQSQIQQQQLPLPQIQRSSSMLSANPLSQLMGQNSNLQMNPNQMVNNKSAQIQQFQMLQQQQAHQQQQQQQQNPMQRKIMMGLGGAMGIGNVGNNMVGLGNLGNIMGMGGVRGMSSPMGPLSGLGNVSPNQMNMGSASNFGTGMRANQMAVAQAAAIAKIRNQQNRAGIYGQSGIAGLTGNSNQMLPSSAGLSMLGPTLNRANMNPLQRNMMAPMGPPKIPGTNYFLNQHQQLQFQQQQQPQLQQQQLQQQQLQQQQQQQLQQQQQQIQQQLQQQQQQQQQQQISSPLQQSQVGSPPVVGSPSAMMMQPQPQQQQQISPQQMGQQSAMSPQLSSGALQQMNNGGNVGGTPASPQLSSQTHGSVGSITSSPMEQLQGANKGGSSV